MKRRDALGLDLTPLIDVVFILIIFFIVSSTFKNETFALNLTLPDSHAKQLDVKIKEVSIELSAKELAFNGEKLDFVELQKKLETITQKDKPIIVHIDSSVNYKRVVQLLDILQLNNLNNLALVTKED